MPDPALREYVAGAIRITVQRRCTTDDEGVAVRVYGRIGQEERQVLRFDCFRNSPHYHYDPQGKDEVHQMADEDITDPIEWTVNRLERSLADMVRRAGFGQLADQIDPSLLATQLPAIREAIAELAQPDEETAGARS
ncbi:MAG TPA: hypothetical protein EYP14_08795 [Planctomycetaceae bacterium]|nr:hypothetical protein [Planctomycetaceae bacterium]